MKKIAGRNNKNNISKKTRTVQKGATGNECESSDSDIPQVEWQKVTPKKRKDRNQPTLSGEEPGKLMSFWDLVGSERNDRVKPENMLQLQASTELISPRGDSTSANDSKSLKWILQPTRPQKSQK